MKFGSFIVRVTIIATTVLFVSSFAIAETCGIDILGDWYVLMFEACVVCFAFGNKRYHCRNIRFLSLAILVCDLFTRIDNGFDILPVEAHNKLPIFIMGIGILAETILAVRHYSITKRKRKWKQGNYRQ